MADRYLEWAGPYALEDFVAVPRGGYPRLRAPGVYRVGLVDGDGGEVPLRRLRQVDPTGTLYVGKSASGLTRFKGLAKTVMTDHREDPQVPHRGGWNLYIFSLLSELRVRHGMGPGDRRLTLHFAPLEAWSQEDIAWAEAELLLGYRAVFGDNPPGNLSSGEIGSATQSIRARVDAAASRTPSSWFAV